MSPGERKVFSYFWRGTGEILLYALPVNSALKVEVSVGVGKATYEEAERKWLVYCRKLRPIYKKKFDK